MSRAWGPDRARDGRFAVGPVAAPEARVKTFAPGGLPHDWSPVALTAVALRAARDLDEVDRLGAALELQLGIDDYKRERGWT